MYSGIRCSVNGLQKYNVLQIQNLVTAVSKEVAKLSNWSENHPSNSESPLHQILNDSWNYKAAFNKLQLQSELSFISLQEETKNQRLF